MLIAAALSVGLAPMIIHLNRAITVRALHMYERVVKRRVHPPLDANQGASPPARRPFRSKLAGPAANIAAATTLGVTRLREITAAVIHPFHHAALY